LYSPDDKKSQNLVLKFVALAADMIENAYFLDRFKRAWVLQLSRSAEFLQVQTDYLIAFDEHGTVLAANRRAQAELFTKKTPRAATVEDLFQLRKEALIRMGAAAQAPVVVHALKSNTPYFGHVRAPLGLGFAPAFARSAPAAAAPRPTAHIRQVDTTSTISPQIRANLTKNDIPPVVSERDRIIDALRRHRWQFVAAARALGISRATLYRKTHAHAIVSPNKLDTGAASI
jgi:transcriptional regulator of acetoin/glycerol metabolism